MDLLSLKSCILNIYAFLFDVFLYSICHVDALGQFPFFHMTKTDIRHAVAIEVEAEPTTIEVEAEFVEWALKI